jgi:hypothetical protein
MHKLLVQIVKRRAVPLVIATFRSWSGGRTTLKTPVYARSLIGPEILEHPRLSPRVSKRSRSTPVRFLTTGFHADGASGR